MTGRAEKLSALVVVSPLSYSAMVGAVGGGGVGDLGIRYG
ncbi:ABC-type methionine transport system permease subunit [Bradyrhizobium sp. USDA 4524]